MNEAQTLITLFGGNPWSVHKKHGHHTKKGPGRKHQNSGATEDKSARATRKHDAGRFGAGLRSYFAMMRKWAYREQA